jgi:hypothetical protein
VIADFSAYEAEIGPEELKEYLEKLENLKGSLRGGAAQQQHAADGAARRR